MKKFLLIALALIMALSCFVSCGGSDTPVESTPAGSKPAATEPSDSTPSETQPEGSTPAETQPTESDTETEDMNNIGNLDPTINLGGMEVTIISRDDPWMKDEVSV